MEITEFGWAFGQISDMEKFWSGLDEDVHSNGVLVTGYSLGGNMATSFAFLCKGEGTKNPVAVKEVYTFNGAGIGTVTGVRRQNLA